MEKQSDLSRQEILKKIAVVSNRRTAISISTDNSNSIYKSIQQDIVNCFITELESVNGQCVLCENEADVFIQLKSFIDERNFNLIFCKDDLLLGQLRGNEIYITSTKAKFFEMQVGITSCEYLVARTGSVIVSSFSTSAKKMNVYPPVHIVIAKVSQLVEYLEDALVLLQQKYSESFPAVISTITGPSRTADIEKTLVLGAHGPKEFIVFLSKV